MRKCWFFRLFECVLYTVLDNNEHYGATHVFIWKDFKFNETPKNMCIWLMLDERTVLVMTLNFVSTETAHEQNWNWNWKKTQNSGHLSVLVKEQHNYCVLRYLAIFDVAMIIIRWLLMLVHWVCFFSWLLIKQFKCKP